MSLFHIPHLPLAKFCAVTAALTCAGGGAFAGRSLSSAAAVPKVAVPSVAPLDHYLCVGDFGHAGCDPVTVGLPDGTNVGVSDPNRRLVCDRVRRVTQVTGSVQVVNEFSPTGPTGATPVELEKRRLRATCATKLARPVFRPRAQAAPTPLPSYTCTSVRYPSPTSARFQSPASLTINGRFSVRMLNPSRLCVPNDVSTTSAGAGELLCFRLSVAENTRRRGIAWNRAPWLRLCVPTSESAAPPAENPSTTSTASSTSTSSSSTSTTASTTTTTTTTAPPPTTTTSTSTTSTTSTSTSTSTTSTTRPQPCAGVIINGVCVIPL